MKKNKLFLAHIIVVIVLLIWEIFRGTLSTHLSITHPLGWLLVVNIATYVLRAAFFVLTAVIISLMKKLSAYNVIALCVSIVVIGLGCLPLSASFAKFNVELMGSARQEIIDEVENGTFDGVQIDTQTHIVPFTVSYTSTAMIDDGKVMFDVYSGLTRKSVVVYVSDGETLEETDFSDHLPNGYALGFTKICKITDNYYFAIIE